MGSQTLFTFAIFWLVEKEEGKKKRYRRLYIRIPF
jgi:hypothetical protein